MASLIYRDGLRRGPLFQTMRAIDLCGCTWCIGLFAIVAGLLNISPLLAQAPSVTLPGTVVDGGSLASAPLVASTVVGRQFAENLPLNGRSFQALLELTPGVVLTALMDMPNAREGDQFGVNGQRSKANYFTIDGVSANIRITSEAVAFPTYCQLGQLRAITVPDTTNSSVSIEPLGEIRIQTSRYAPEFGRTPGGQILMATRSGTNSIRESVSERFRDDAPDAAYWSINMRCLDKSALRHHNFGVVEGGPVRGNDLFLFGSYESWRCKQPRLVTANERWLETQREKAAIVPPSTIVEVHEHPAAGRYRS